MDDQTSDNPEVHRLIKENNLLKRLLSSMGLGADFLETYAKASDLAPEISAATVQPDNQLCCRKAKCSSPENVESILPITIDPTLLQSFSGIDDTVGAELHIHSPSPFSQNQRPPENLISWEATLDAPTYSLSALGMMPEKYQPDSCTPIVQHGRQDSTTEAPPNTEIVDSTTLCSVAFSMIMKNNRKGYNASELDLKLRTGYRNCSMWSDGCRVENKTLFNVLAEIS